MYAVPNSAPPAPRAGSIFDIGRPDRAHSVALPSESYPLRPRRTKDQDRLTLCLPAHPPPGGPSLHSHSPSAHRLRAAPLRPPQLIDRRRDARPHGRKARESDRRPARPREEGAARASCPVSAMRTWNPPDDAAKEKPRRSFPRQGQVNREASRLGDKGGRRPPGFPASRPEPIKPFASSRRRARAERPNQTNGFTAIVPLHDEEPGIP